MKSRIGNVFLLMLLIGLILTGMIASAHCDDGQDVKVKIGNINEVQPIGFTKTLVIFTDHTAMTFVNVTDREYSDLLRGKSYLGDTSIVYHEVDNQRFIYSVDVPEEVDFPIWYLVAFAIGLIVGIISGILLVIFN